MKCCSRMGNPASNLFLCIVTAAATSAGFCFRGQLTAEETQNSLPRRRLITRRLRWACLKLLSNCRSTPGASSISPCGTRRTRLRALLPRGLEHFSAPAAPPPTPPPTGGPLALARDGTGSRPAGPGHALGQVSMATGSSTSCSLSRAEHLSWRSARRHRGCALAARRPGAVACLRLTWPRCSTSSRASPAPVRPPGGFPSPRSHSSSQSSLSLGTALASIIDGGSPSRCSSPTRWYAVGCSAPGRHAALSDAEQPEAPRDRNSSHAGDNTALSDFQRLAPASTCACRPVRPRRPQTATRCIDGRRDRRSRQPLAAIHATTARAHREHWAGPTASGGSPSPPLHREGRRPRGLAALAHATWRRSPSSVALRIAICSPMRRWRQRTAGYSSSARFGPIKHQASEDHGVRRPASSGAGIAVGLIVRRCPRASRPRSLSIDPVMPAMGCASRSRCPDLPTRYWISTGWSSSETSMRSPSSAAGITGSMLSVSAFDASRRTIVERSVRPRCRRRSNTRAIRLRAGSCRPSRARIPRSPDSDRRTLRRSWSSSSSLAAASRSESASEWRSDWPDTARGRTPPHRRHARAPARSEGARACT